MTTRTLTSEQMEALLLLLGYRPQPSRGPQRVFENQEVGAVQLLPPAGKEVYARIEHLMTLRKVSIEKGLVDSKTFDELLEQVQQSQVTTTGSTSAA